MKKTTANLIVVLEVILSMVISAIGWPAVAWLQAKENMTYFDICRSPKEGEDVFYLETDKTVSYIAIDFPQNYNTDQVVESLKSQSSDEIAIWQGANEPKYHIYRDPLGEGNEYVLLIPTASYAPFLSQSRLLAYYAKEVVGS